jgi:hypothetical protein
MTRREFTDAYLESLRAVGDPEADEIVDDFVQAAGQTDPKYLVQRLMKHQRTLPEPEQVPSVRDYFERPVALPPWADVETLRRGQRFFSTFGIHIASALYCASLPMSYTSGRGSQVLTHTMAMVSDTRRRLAQTGEMLLDVMGANDAADALPFGPGTAAYRAPRGVRLFHAAVRSMLRNDPNYDRCTIGEPINQEDLLGTLATFTVVVVDALQRFGVPVSDADRDAYVRLWLTTGYLLGIEPTLLLSRHHPGPVPLTWEELVALSELIEKRHAGPSTAGRTLMEALLEEEADALPFGLKRLPSACTRHLIGDDHSDDLAVPPAGWTRVLLRPLPIVNRTLFARVYYDLSGWLFAKLARNLYRSWIARSSPGGPHPWRYDPVQQPWKLGPAHTRVLRVARHPVRNGVYRCAEGTAFAAR